MVHRQVNTEVRFIKFYYVKITKIKLFVLAQFLHIFFPGLALKTAFELFYSRVGQHTSVGNYWKDPYHQPLYLNYSEYLPYVNNEIESSKSADFKSSLAKLNMMVLIGGPDDNVITPWQSRYYYFFNYTGI